MALGSRHSGMTKWEPDTYMLRDVPSARCVIEFYLSSYTTVLNGVYAE